MVHALREAHRALKPDGLLIDIRPAAVHRRIGIASGGRFRLVGIMRETFDEDRAADAAVARMMRERRFRLRWRGRFECERIMDCVGDFREWALECSAPPGEKGHAWLGDRLDAALARHGRPAKIVARAPVKVAVLEKR